MCPNKRMTEKSLQFYREALTSLKQDTASQKKYGSAAPHKPVLVISLIQAFEEGLVIDQNVYLTPEFVALFTFNWSALVASEGYQPTIAQPFYHLSNEKKKWWRLVPNPGCEYWIDNAGSMHSFRNLTKAVDHAVIDAELALLLSQPAARELLRQAVLEKYFPKRTTSDLSGSGTYMDRIGEEILTEDSAAYIANVRKINERLSGDAK
jgi:putative restriction endonuclease